MASDLHVITLGDIEPERALDLLDHLEARWSRFLPDSDITRLNLAGGAEVEVDASTVALVDAMVHARHVTGGAFDPTVLPVLLDAGYAVSTEDPRRVTLLPDGAVVFDDRRQLLGDVITDPHRSTVALPAGLVVDPGGIGKGLAADLAVHRLLDAGATGALVSIGGDLAIGGEPPRQVTDEPGWPVVVANPHTADGSPVGTVLVTRGGVATSSTRSRRWHHDGRDHHHLIDPFTGAESSTDLATVTVVAQAGWLAEAHATAALLEGTAAVMAYLDRHGLPGVAVTAAGRILPTADLRMLSAADSR